MDVHHSSSHIMHVIRNLLCKAGAPRCRSSQDHSQILTFVCLHFNQHLLMGVPLQDA